MKVYKSKILKLIEKNACKARKFKRGTVERYGSAGAFYEIENGKVTFVQGKYAIESALTTSTNDEKTEFYRCDSELYINPALFFEIDSDGNAIQDGFTHNRAFTVVDKAQSFKSLLHMDRPTDYQFVEFDRKLLIELLAYFDEPTVKIRILYNVGDRNNLLQIGDKLRTGILMPIVRN